MLTIKGTIESCTSLKKGKRVMVLLDEGEEFPGTGLNCIVVVESAFSPYCPSCGCTEMLCGSHCADGDGCTGGKG